MKYIKTFENLNKNVPKIGDYVYCEEEYNGDRKIVNKISNFLKDNIGQIVQKSKEEPGYYYIVKYENVPKELKDDCFDHDGIDGGRRMDLSEIIYWNEDPNEIEVYIATKKYNL